MVWLTKSWHWMLIAGIAVAGFGIWIFLKITGQKRAAALARADTTETIFVKQIAQKQVEIDRLQVNANANAAKINDVNKAIEDSKVKLKEKFESHGLSAEELSRRFNRLNL